MLESAAALLSRADGAIKAAETTNGEAASWSVSGIFEGEPLSTLRTIVQFWIDDQVVY
jgi:hypothetical protein